jgi:hypothetical protein
VKGSGGKGERSVKAADLLTSTRKDVAKLRYDVSGLSACETLRKGRKRAGDGEEGGKRTGRLFPPLLLQHLSPPGP